MEKLALIPDLMGLVKNPFLLKLFLAMPTAIGDARSLSDIKITRLRLYDKFVRQWIKVSKARLEKMNLGKDAAVDDLFEVGFEKLVVGFLKELAQAIVNMNNKVPVVEYVHHKDSGTWKVNFFGKESKTTHLREASPLTRDRNLHKFIHLSLYHYFYSLCFHDPADNGGGDSGSDDDGPDSDDDGSDSDDDGSDSDDDDSPGENPSGNRNDSGSDDDNSPGGNPSGNRDDSDSDDDDSHSDDDDSPGDNPSGNRDDSAGNDNDSHGGDGDFADDSDKPHGDGESSRGADGDSKSPGAHSHGGKDSSDGARDDHSPEDTDKSKGTLLITPPNPFENSNLINEPWVLEFLVQRVKDDKAFKKRLLSMIKKSKSGVNAYLAAANAITILVRGGVRLDGIDLEGVRIPKDYLSGSYIDAAQLADSGLTAVELVQALLRSSDSRTEATAAQQHVQFAYRPGMIIENAKAESSNVRIDIDLRVSVSHSGTRADNQQYKRPNPPRHFQKDFTKSAMD
ncbi:hypothetical protein BGZ58_008203, partial [Dissophora ornata]